MFALALMLSIFTVWMKSVFPALGAVLFGALGFLWLMPGLKTSQKVRRFKKEAKTNECEAPSMRKKAFMAIAVAAIPVFLALVHAGR